MKKVIYLITILASIHSFGQSVEILPGDNNNGNIISNSGSNPAFHIFKSGTTNPNKMVISHSPDYTDWGLQYRDVPDHFAFLADNKTNLYIGLNPDSTSFRLGLATDAPLDMLHLNGGDLRVSGTYPYTKYYKTNSIGAMGALFYNNAETVSGFVGYNENDNILTISRNQNEDDLVVSSNGRVGVGTVDPSTEFHVLGQETIEDTFPFVYLKTTGALGSGNGGITFRDASNTSQAVINYNHVDDHIRLVNGTSTSDGLYLANANLVGIGTNDPGSKLHINHNGSDSSPQLLLLDDGSSGQSRLNFGSVENNRRWILQSDTDFSTETDDYLRIEHVGNGSTSGSELFRIEANGNVGIGTSSPNNKLDVLGVIRAEEVIVETGWADYVFESSYKLKDLEAVEAFIAKNNHLPNVPSAKEIQSSGAKVSALMTVMMEKIEELTLYTIQQGKEINALKAQINK